MIKYYFRTIKDESLKELDAPRTGVWVHVEDPSDQDLQTLVDEFALDEMILADSRDFFEVPRLEKSGNATYFFARYPYEQSEEDIDTAPILIAIGESFVLTIALRDVPQLEPFFSGQEEVHTTQKAKLFIQMIYAIATSYEQKLTKLRRAVHRNRINVRQIGNREISRLVNYEHELNDIIAAVVPMNNWLQQLIDGNFLQLYQEDTVFMEDLMIANSQLVDSARSVLKTIQNIRTASEAILTNNLNASIRTLTVLTILLTIPTIIASLYGMNLELPLSNQPFAFWIIIGLILAVVAVMVWLFRRNKWL